MYVNYGTYCTLNHAMKEGPPPSIPDNEQSFVLPFGGLGLGDVINICPEIKHNWAASGIVVSRLDMTREAVEVQQDSVFRNTR